MKRILAPLALVVLAAAACGQNADPQTAPDPAASSQAPADDGAAVAQLSPQSALDAASDANSRQPRSAGGEWGWVEDPDAVVSLPQSVGLLKANSRAFDYYDNQFIAEEIQLACMRLDENGTVEQVAYGQGFEDWGRAYWKLMIVAAPVGCTRHEPAVNRWVDEG